MKIISISAIVLSTTFSLSLSAIDDVYYWKRLEDQPLAIVNGYIVKYSEALRIKSEYIESTIILEAEDAIKVFGNRASGGALVITLKSRSTNYISSTKVDDDLLKEAQRVADERDRLIKEEIEAERKAAEEQARLEAERKAAEEQARLEAERKAAEEQARLEAERKAAEEQARLEAERKAAEEQARLEAERKAAEEQARLEAERKAAEEQARLEAERKTAEEKARLEAERKAAEEQARLEAERKAAEEQARLEAERKAAEEQARLEAERKAAEGKARLEANRIAKLEAERKAAAEQARLDAERKASQKALEEQKEKILEDTSSLSAEFMGLLQKDFENSILNPRVIKVRVDGKEVTKEEALKISVFDVDTSITTYNIDKTQGVLEIKLSKK